MWYDSLSGALEKGVGIFQSLAECISKSTLDKTEKERIMSQIQQAKLTLELETLRLRLSVSWMKWIAYGSGIILGLIIINNNIIMPYFPIVKALEIPNYLWIVFGSAIGADKISELTINEIKNKKKEKGD